MSLSALAITPITMSTGMIIRLSQYWVARTMDSHGCAMPSGETRGCRQASGLSVTVVLMNLPTRYTSAIRLLHEALFSLNLGFAISFGLLTILTCLSIPIGRPLTP